jgi:hypothetical protein
MPRRKKEQVEGELQSYLTCGILCFGFGEPSSPGVWL